MSSTITQAFQLPLVYRFYYKGGVPRTLRIYHPDKKKTVAYTIITLSHVNTIVSKSPNLFVYRDTAQPDSIQSDHDPQRHAIATATLTKYRISMSLSVNGRPIEVSLHTIGLWKYAREWESCRGFVKWKHGRFGSELKLVDEKGEILGQWKPDGNTSETGRLQFLSIGEEEAAQWEDEIVSVASAISTARRWKG